MNKVMRIETSQGDVVIDILDKETKIGVRISGGVDSTMVLYLMAIFKRDYRPDIKILPMTVVNPFKPYQEIFSNRVIDKVKELTGVEIGELDAFFPTLEDRTKFGEAQIDRLRIWYRVRRLDTHVMGETKNPPLDVDAQFQFSGAGREPKRDEFVTGDDIILLKTRPFRNIDKQGVAELYEKFGLTDTLFPITRSCEKHTTDFTAHCEECWFCEERKWGFGRYE